MSISELFSLPDEDKKAIFEQILQQANRSQRKMVINQEYIQQHLNKQYAIKLRALDINNFLSDVETGYDYREYDWCGVVHECVDIEIEYGRVVLSYEDGDWDQRSWSVPLELFNMSDEELVEYAKQQAAAQSALDKKVDYARLRKEAKNIGYRLVPIENTGEGMSNLIATENILFRCPAWDCGWCYAPAGKDTSDDNGQCNKPLECKYRQEIILKVINESNDEIS